METHDDIRELRGHLHTIRANPHLREACSMLLDQVSAGRLGLTTASSIKGSRSWATATAEPGELSTEARELVARVVYLVNLLDKKCTYCHREIMPGLRWTAAVTADDGSAMHANCVGAKATMDLAERSITAMRFAGESAELRLVGDLYEPGEPWRPMSVVLDTRFGWITIEPRANMIGVSWSFFESPLTRTDRPMELEWPDGAVDAFVLDELGHRGSVDIRKPGDELGTVFALLIKAASACLRA